MADSADSVNLCIPINSILDEFVCPVCFLPITDCYITPCGHNFCHECITEWIARAHTCPLCAATDLTVDRIVKNTCFDNIYQKVSEEKEKAAKSYFHRVATGGGDDAGAGAGSSSASSSVDLSPIEAVFRKHMAKTLGSYSSYLQEINTRFDRRKREIAGGFAKRVEEIRASHRAILRVEQEHLAAVDAPLTLPPPDSLALSRTISLEESESKLKAAVEWRDKELAAVKAQHDASVSSLVKEYDTYLESSAPLPSVVPSLVTVSVPKTGWRFDVQFRASDFLQDVVDALKARATGLGDPVTSIGPDCVWELLDPTLVGVAARAGTAAAAGAGAGSGPDATGPGAGAGAGISAEALAGSGTVLVADKTLFSQAPGERILPGSMIVCRGPLTLRSDAPKLCFSKTFKKGEKQRMDYFTCEQCRCNWICKTCAETCHASHPVRPYVLQHKPSYGCCYCVKKRLCTLK